MAIDPKDRPVRQEPNPNIDEQELNASNLTPGADPPKNADARGGYGNRDGKQGFGTDSAGGITAVSMNRNTDNLTPPGDNMRTEDEGRQDRADQDLPTPPNLDPRRVNNGPADELEADDRRKGPDEMEDPDSRVGMGQMEAKAPGHSSGGAYPSTATPETNASEMDRNAEDSGLEV